MNSLYTLGVRQTSSLHADLERMKAGDASAGLQGQIAASLAALNRTVDDYDSMAKRELVKAKQEKAISRVQKFRGDHVELRNEFERLKLLAANARSQAQRSELLNNGTNNPASPSVTRQRFSQPQQPPSDSENPFSHPPSTNQGSQGLRQSHLLNEHSFIQQTETQLDNFLAQGQAVLENLVDQRNILKGTQRRLLDAANTLGLSRNVIGWIEKRSTQDTYIFAVGAVVTFLCFFMIWKYLG